MATKSQKYVDDYYVRLQKIEQTDVKEGATRFAFQALLEAAGKEHRFNVVAEQSQRVTKKNRIQFDGEVRDEFGFRRGLWEAKDTDDDLDAEINKKIRAGYPTSNIIFEDTRRAVLYQSGNKVLDVDITSPGNLVILLDTFFHYAEPEIEKFHLAVEEFRSKIPVLARNLSEMIDVEKSNNPNFRAALDTFLELCRSALNPATSLDEVEDMLKQHLLTERIFRSVFDNPDFVRRNVIAREIENVIDKLTSRSFSRDAWMRQLDPFYRAIEQAASTISDYEEKQSFLNTVYERFFQSYSTDTADTHGIVYTPTPLVRWMVASVEQALQREFGKSLSNQGVHILDPCVGTGTFMLDLIHHISSSSLQQKYEHELHCNEILLLPYYIASQNIEHEYFERTGSYSPFSGICFADTLEMGKAQAQMFAPTNTQRVVEQELTPIFVVIGNPPYNVGQESENDNNKNRKHPHIDGRVRDTYARASKATNKNALSDTYVKFFRWATDRLGDRDGIVCFVSNNLFLDGIAFDGMRRELAKDFTSIHVLDLGGNVRKNPKLSGTAHNVFGIQVGVSITLLVRSRRGQEQTQPATIYYARLNEQWRKEQKYDYLNQTGDYTNQACNWQQFIPDARASWLTEGLVGGFDDLLPLGSKEGKSATAGASTTIFRTYSNGVKANRDEWVFNFNLSQLEVNIAHTIEAYNAEVDRWKRREDRTSKDVDNFVTYDDKQIKWSRDLKLDLQRSNYAIAAPVKFRHSIYRPFCAKYYFFDRILNEEVYVFPRIFPTPATENENVVVCISAPGSRQPFATLAVNKTPAQYLTDATQCFPFYTYNEDGTGRQENISDAALKMFQVAYKDEGITKWDIFHYVYAVLQAPEYRTHYGANLKRDLPRIPFVAGVEAFRAYVRSGQELMSLHINYQQVAEYPLALVEDRNVPFTWRVTRMRLITDRTQLKVNSAITLTGIPAAAYEYRLGNRSALDWIIDQYAVVEHPRSGIKDDPNDPQDEQAIVRLVKQVVTVSLETVRIINALPPLSL